MFLEPRFRPLLFAVPALIILSGCASLQPSKPPAPKPPRPPVSKVPASARKSYWNAQAVEGAPWIVIVLGEQRAFFFKGQTLVGESKVSSGKKRFETPAGEYRVLQKDKNHASNLYGKIFAEDGSLILGDADTSKHKVPPGGSFAGAKMPYFLRFHGGYGLHAGRVPNYPASHGCVRLPAHMAPHFFEHASLGTPVSVISSLTPEVSPGQKPEPAMKTGEFRWPWQRTAPAAGGRPAAPDRAS